MSSCGEKDSTLREQSFDEAWLFHRGDIAEGEKQSLDDSQWRQINLPHERLSVAYKSQYSHQ